ncbi:MAG: hypothetical protein II963_09585 [Bacteroidales bacterium]|nr:hypothetical protein [Bacteroidales bacterium]
MKRLLIVLLVALAAVGCKDFEGDRVAKVGNHVLYMKDIRGLLPAGVTPEDSAAMVQQYINTWALAHLKVLKAQELLSPEAKDVTAEVEDYRNNLLKYRLERQVTESELDTTVTDEEMRQYYEEHSQNYKFPYIIAKARIITLSQTSPNYDTVKKNYAVKPEEGEQPGDLFASYAERVEDFGGNWVPMPTIAKAVPGLDAESCETIFRGGDTYIKVGDGKDYFILLLDKVPVGRLAPYEYCRQTIKDAILIARKQDILTKLEQDLLQEGIESEKLKIYDVE